MRILISGADGFIGRYVTRRVLGAGHEVVAIARRPPAASASGNDRLQWLAWDLASQDMPALDGLGIDGAIHLVAAMSGSLDEQRRTTVDGTANFLRALRHGGVRRLVGISSLAVIDYASLPPMTTVDEKSRTCVAQHAMGVYSYVKARQETLFAEFARDENARCIILRPGLVYENDALPVAHAGIFKQGYGFVVSHQGRVPIVDVATVADAVLCCLEAELQSGEVLHLVDDDLPTQSQYVTHLKSIARLPERTLSVPWTALDIGLGRLHGIMSSVGMPHRTPQPFRPHSLSARFKPLLYTNAKAKRLLGWQPARFENRRPKPSEQPRTVTASARSATP